jgi:hypothetical protein
MLAELLERPQQQMSGLAAAAEALRQREVMLQEMQVETEVMELHLPSPARLSLMLEVVAEVLATIRMVAEIRLAQVVLAAEALAAGLQQTRQELELQTRAVAGAADLMQRLLALPLAATVGLVL